MRILFASVLIFAPAGHALATQDGRPVAEQGYAGLSLRDIPGGHTVVSWVFPGPLEGEGLAAPKVDLARPDLVVAVNGQSMTADEWHEYVLASNPGDRVVLEVRTSRARGGAIPDALDHEDEIRAIELTLASRDEWIGTMKRPRQSTREIEFNGPPLLDPFDRDNVLGSAVGAHELGVPVRTLLGVFDEWIEKDHDHHMLSIVRAGFREPFRADELPALLDHRQWPGEDPLVAARRLIENALDLEPLAYREDWDPPRQVDHIGPETELARSLADTVIRSSHHLERAFDHRFDEKFARSCVDFLRVPKDTFYIQGPGAKPHIDVIRASMHAKLEHLPAAIPALPEDELFDGVDMSTLDESDLPDELRGALEGPIHSARRLVLPAAGPLWVVIGSHEDNRYDLSRIAVVFDPAGDDEYHASDLRVGARLVIDLAGNDQYTGTPDQGPGSALLGVSLIDDRVGDDRYEGATLSAGAAMYGLSILLDRGGSDTYLGDEWSLGAGCYGAGLIIDLGHDADIYLGDFLCQGVGGPRGFGCIVDHGGRDLYRANGPTGSAYGTSAVYQSFSQGIGFGYRNYAAGGIGMIRDLGGDDRYEAGEFAQGGAYYYGLGILHDVRGRDLYYGNRYGQGFGVHQAVGLLVDDEGDDTYWSMTAASQGSAWDIGVGLLLDRSGNDSYQCDALGQGGASMQAIGMLVDLAGTDRYAARGGAAQGESGGNSYHFHKTGAFSFGLLLDRGGADDWYSAGRRNNSVQPTGTLREDEPQHSTLHGLFVDE